LYISLAVIMIQEWLIFFLLVKVSEHCSRWLKEATISCFCKLLSHLFNIMLFYPHKKNVYHKWCTWSVYCEDKWYYSLSCFKLLEWTQLLSLCVFHVCALRNVLYVHDTPTNAHLHVLVHHISTERLYHIYLSGKLPHISFHCDHLICDVLLLKLISRIC